MSPNESQLRAALHDGEGDGIDPNRVIAQAQLIRRRRRVTIASVAGTVAAVAAIAITVPLIARGGGSAASSRNAVTSQQDHAAAGQATGSASSAVPSSGAKGGAPPLATEPPACPESAPAVSLPSAASAGGGGQLFPTPITALRICDVTDRTSYVFTGDKAQTLADDLNALPASSPAAPCPSDYGPVVVLIAIDANGDQTHAVGNAGGCGLIVSGSAYRTTAREVLRGLLAALPSPVQLPTDKTAARASPGPGPS
jgi:hypothetical protein